MVQSGLTEEWWTVLECYCHLWKVHDRMANSWRTFEFRAVVSYKSISSKDEARLHQNGKTHVSPEVQ